VQLEVVDRNKIAVGLYHLKVENPIFRVFNNNNINQEAQLLQWDALAGGLMPLYMQNKFAST